MQARAEITGKFAYEYARASKKDKGQILIEVVAVTGWSRDNARRRLVQVAKAARSRCGFVTAAPTRKPVTKARKPRARRYSYDSIKILQVVWAASGGLCGKYLVEAMTLQLDLLEAHKELPDRRGRYTPAVRAELESMSPATIDRYLAPVKARDPIRGIAATKPSPLLRTSIKVRKAGDEVEQDPGFFEVDTVAHCGPVLKGEFVRTVNLTDVLTGWVFTRSIKNIAHTHIEWALTQAYMHVPYQVSGMDFDNGSEFINHAVIRWASELDIYFTRSRPYKKNDQATVESKNGHLVRKYAGHWRYDTPEALRILNRMWPLVNDRLNFLTPTKKPIGWTTTANGRRKRIYDTPATPLDRLLATGTLSPAQAAELIAYRDSLNPADLQRRIDGFMTRLRNLAARPTADLLHQLKPKPLPDVTKGVRLRSVS